MIVEGEFVQARLHSSFMGRTIYRPVAFRLADGSVRSFPRIAVADRMRDTLKPGMSGRFYLQRFMGRTIIQAVRSRERTLFAYPTTDAILTGMAALIGSMMLILHLAISGGELPVRWLVIALFGAISFLIYRTAERKGREFFDEDGPSQAAGQARSAPVTSL